MPQISNIAKSITAARWAATTSPSVEWTWVVGRVFVSAIIIPTAFIAFGGIEGAEAIFGAIIAVLIYSVGLAYLLKRGKVNLTFWAGFTLDNCVALSSWWWTVRNIDPAKADTDMWMAILPIIFVGVVRLGTRMGVLYLCVWLGMFSWLTLEYQPPGSYGLEQLPTRLMFVALVCVITIWLVTRLNVERNTAKQLQSEAEQIAEIGRIINSSLTPANVFPMFASRVKPLIPYQRLGLVELDLESRSFWMVSSDGDDSPAMPQGQTFPLPESGPAMKVLSARMPIMLDEEGCKELFRHFRQGMQPYAARVKSMIISPIVTGDKVIGALFARSILTNAFTERHLHILVRITDYIGSAMANSQIYRQAMQLANERETRLKLDSENRDLHRQNHARTMFLSAVSHELRTPLTSIIAFNDMLLKNRNGSFNEREMLQLNVMRRNSQQLYMLVNDLLDLSHIESGKVQLSSEKFAVGEAVADIVNSIEPILKPRRQKLTIEQPREKVTVTADRQRFGQVVSNLLSNASKYSPEGKEIRLRWGVQNDRLELSVTDKGSGIPEKLLPLLFEPFFRVPQHRADKIPGTGLGLVISKSLVEAHGGEIWLESTEGKGTTASFWIPFEGFGLSRKSGSITEAA